ncbi:DUF3293 domain-containing protein [Thioalkalivibrio sp. HL-Eb18]|uniref:DUF3293 domain-containing protein n=1 Tax=Thioalkalivibrio sp. HL-Eb18 TaxID=1266913 RepID=UPI0003650EA5|nr:DUF3293 domain-containing protein [Thioalkalivibrio sp. HL-Eb18]
MTPNSRGNGTPSNAPGANSELARAYSATHYRIELPGQAFVLRIGERDPGLETCLQTEGWSQASLLTAWNPRSRIVPEQENRERHARIARELEQAGWSCWPTLHRDPTGYWPDEPGYCVLGMGAADLDPWLVAFDQNAAVLIQPPSAPRLIWHPGERPGSRCPTSP